jgi:hypothetical protein
MKTTAGLLMTVAVLCAANSKADIGLFEWGLNLDGVVTGSGDPLPPGSTLDTANGLGTVHLLFTGAGAHSSILFVDHEMSEAANTFFNELGEVSGVPSAGASWEIDEPGFSSSPGDIFDNFLTGTLDNSVGKADPDDVSMAMGWNFILGAGEQGTLDFLLTEAPPTGFYLRHYDPDSGEELFFTASLTISPISTVPEVGSTLPLLLSGIAVILRVGARRRN